MNSWECHNCGDLYEKGEKPYYGDGKIVFCAHCWGLLLKEKLPFKKAIRKLNKNKTNIKS